MSAAASIETQKSEWSIAEQAMTCAACDRILAVDCEGVLPRHIRDAGYILTGENGCIEGLISALCPGSLTKGRPHRMLPEAKPLPRGFTYLDILPDDDEGKRGGNRDIAAIAVCAKVVCDWLGPQIRMRIDDVQMSKIIAACTRARQAAENLMRTSG